MPEIKINLSGREVANMRAKKIPFTGDDDEISYFSTNPEPDH